MNILRLESNNATSEYGGLDWTRSETERLLPGSLVGIAALQHHVVQEFHQINRLYLFEDGNVERKGFEEQAARFMEDTSQILSQLEDVANSIDHETPDGKNIWNEAFRRSVAALDRMTDSYSAEASSFAQVWGEVDEMEPDLHGIIYDLHGNVAAIGATLQVAEEQKIEPNTPPKNIEYLMHLAIKRPKERERFLGDLSEQFTAVAQEFGITHANVFYAWWVTCGIVEVWVKNIKRLKIMTLLPEVIKMLTNAK